MKSLRLATLLFAFTATAAHADDPYVWFDTDRGPIVLELDTLNAPRTSAHFLGIVNEGYYNDKVFYRTIPNFIIQAGIYNSRATVQLRQPNPTLGSESNNGLPNVVGSIAIALPNGSNGQPNRNGGTVEFFINTARNSQLDADFTVFGQVVYGMPTVNAIGNAANYPGSTTPFIPTLIRRAVQSDGFPLMPLHTGSWYDPANSGRGVSLEVSTAAGGDGSPLLVAYWYDYFEGQQIWMTGAAPFSYGDSAVTVPLQISEGGAFGPGYDPSAVNFDHSFGTLTVRFSGCNAGEFDYNTQFGSGTLHMVRLTIPDRQACTAN